MCLFLHLLGLNKVLHVEHWDKVTLIEHKKVLSTKKKILSNTENNIIQLLIYITIFREDKKLWSVNTLAEAPAPFRKIRNEVAKETCSARWGLHASETLALSCPSKMYMSAWIGEHKDIDRNRFWKRKRPSSVITLV